MTQNFAMAFGGSGARCMEALIYLTASRGITTPLHLLVVDPDATNGNVSQVLAQLRRYHAIQAQVEPLDSDGCRAFFSTPVNADHGDDSFHWSNPQQHTQFATLIEYAAQPPEARALLDLLYDQSDLELTFSKGYIGRAHIGSLDLLRTLRTQIVSAAQPQDGQRARPDSMVSFFRAVRAATQQPGGARLLVIGSVFGGTGASGLPAVPPLLSNLLLQGLQQDLAMGCVQLAPYFSFPPGREEDPDSALHPLATRAALYHYALTDVGYRRIYFLGAPGREQSNNENVVGGDAQRNLAHYVELGAALAAAHFFASPPERENPEVVASATEEISWDKLPARELTNARRNLVAFATFCRMHADFLASALEQRRHLETKWLSDLESRNERKLGGQELELRELRDFSVRFLSWMEEVQRVSGVNLFRVGTRETEDALAAVTVSGGAALEHPYHEIIYRLNQVPPTDQRTGTGWYVHALTHAVQSFCSKNYEAWWSR